MQRFAGIVLATLLIGAAPSKLLAESTGKTRTPQHLRPTEEVTESETLWYSNPDWWVAGFTGALFMATTGLWFATWRLWRSTNQAVGDAAKGLEISEKTFRHAKESTERQLRAYVFVTKSAMQIAGINVQSPIAPGSIPVAVLIAENTGQTPAYNMQIFGELDYVGWPINPLSLTTLNLIDPNISKASVGTREETRKIVIFPRPITALEHAGLANGTHALVVHGVIKYDDAFGIARETKFRFFVGGNFGLQGVALGQHAEGNDAC